MKYIYLFMAIMCLGACSTVPVYHVVPTTIPDALLSCIAAPDVPLSPSGRELATFIVDDREAGADCRNKLAAVKKYQDEITSQVRGR